MRKLRLIRALGMVLALGICTPVFAQTNGDEVFSAMKQETAAVSLGAGNVIHKRIAEMKGKSPALMRYIEWAKRDLAEHTDGVDKLEPIPGAVTRFFVSFPYVGTTSVNFGQPLSAEQGFDTNKTPDGVNAPVANWMVYDSQGTMSAIHPQHVVSNSDYQTVYLATRIVIPGKKAVQGNIEIPSTSPVIAWMNGKRVVQNTAVGPSSAPLFGERWAVELNPGENILVIKVAMLDEVPEMYVFLTDRKSGLPLEFSVNIKNAEGEPQHIVSGALDSAAPAKAEPSFLNVIVDNEKASLADRAFAARLTLSSEKAAQKISDLLFSNLDATASMSPDEIELALLALNSPTRGLQILNRAMKKYAGDPRMELIYAREWIMASDEMGSSGTRISDEWSELETKIRALKAPTVNAISYEPLKIKMLVWGELRQNQIYSAVKELNQYPSCDSACQAYIFPEMIGYLRNMLSASLYNQAISLLLSENKSDPGLLVEWMNNALNAAAVSGNNENLAAVLVSILNYAEGYLTTHSESDYMWSFLLNVLDNYGYDSNRAKDSAYINALKAVNFPEDTASWFFLYVTSKINDVSRWKRYAEYCLRQGRTSELLTAYQTIASLQQYQNESTLEKVAMIQMLSGNNTAVAEVAEQRFEQGFIIKDIPASRDPNATGSVSLLENRVVKIYDVGLSSTFFQQVYQIMDEQGVKQRRVTPIFYDPDEEEIEIISVTTRKKDGTVRQLYKEYDQNYADESIQMYYSKRVRIIEIQDLSVGDIVEYQFKIKQKQLEANSTNYFTDMFALQEGVNRQWSKYTLISSEKMPVHIALSDPQNLIANKAIDVKKDGNAVIQSFEVKDLPRMISEDFMPGKSEFYPILIASTFAKWQELVDWFLELSSGQWIADDAIRAKVHELTDGVSDPFEKLTRIHSFVVKSTRYVALEFGIHGHKPYPVPQIFERRFGDCKDKASLLKVMLREAGIDSSFVLVRTSEQGDVMTDVASTGLFNHAILYVPQFDLFIDGTAEFSGTRELPLMDQDGLSLIISDDGSYELRKIPVSKTSDNVVVQKGKLSLTNSDNADFVLDVNMAGMSASAYRERYQIESLRRDRLEAELPRSYPGLHIDSYEFSNLDELEQDVHFTVNGHIQVLDIAKVQGNTLMVYPGISVASYVKTYAPSAKRTKPLTLAAPITIHKEIVIELPPGAQVVLPSPIAEKNAFGSCSLSVVRNGDSLITTVDLVIEKNRIEPEVYHEFFDFIQRIDQWLNTQLKITMPN